MNKMPDSITDGPDYEETVYDREEPDPDDLSNTLRDITLSQQIDRIEDVIESLRTTIGKPQAE